eukprot:scaffold369_cov177-Ochromonas_danica.AAC.18
MVHVAVDEEAVDEGVEDWLKKALPAPSPPLLPPTPTLLTTETENGVVLGALEESWFRVCRCSRRPELRPKDVRIEADRIPSVVFPMGSDEVGDIEIIELCWVIGAAVFYLLCVMWLGCICIIIVDGVNEL